MLDGIIGNHVRNLNYPVTVIGSLHADAIGSAEDLRRRMEMMILSQEACRSGIDKRTSAESSVNDMDCRNRPFGFILAICMIDTDLFA